MTHRAWGAGLVICTICLLALASPAASASTGHTGVTTPQVDDTASPKSTPTDSGPNDTDPTKDTDPTEGTDSTKGTDTDTGDPFTGTDTDTDTILTANVTGYIAPGTNWAARLSGERGGGACGGEGCASVALPTSMPLAFIALAFLVRRRE